MAPRVLRAAVRAIVTCGGGSHGAARRPLPSHGPRLAASVSATPPGVIMIVMIGRVIEARFAPVRCCCLPMPIGTCLRHAGSTHTSASCLGARTTSTSSTAAGHATRQSQHHRTMPGHASAALLSLPPRLPLCVPVCLSASLAVSASVSVPVPASPCVAVPLCRRAPRHTTPRVRPACTCDRLVCSIRLPRGVPVRCQVRHRQGNRPVR